MGNIALGLSYAADCKPGDLSVAADTGARTIEDQDVRAVVNARSR